MSVTYVIEFHVRAGQRERFHRLLDAVLDAMRHEAMFVNAALHVDPDDADHLMLSETWRDHEDVLAVQLHRPYRQAWHDALPELLARERKIAMWRPLRFDQAEAIEIDRAPFK